MRMVTPISLSKAMKSELYDLITDFKEKWPLDASTRKQCDDLVRRMVIDRIEEDDAFNLFRASMQIIKDAVDH